MGSGAFGSEHDIAEFLAIVHMLLILIFNFSF